MGTATKVTLTSPTAGLRQGHGEDEVPWTRSVIAMLLTTTLARALATSITALIGIIMRCIALRPAKSIIFDNNVWPVSQRWSPPRTTGELATRTENLMEHFHVCNTGVGVQLLLLKWCWWRYCKFRCPFFDQSRRQHDVVSAFFAVHCVPRKWYTDQTVPSLLIALP